MMSEIDEDDDFDGKYYTSSSNPFNIESICLNETSEELMKMCGMREDCIVYTITNKPLFKLYSKYTGGMIHSY